MTDDISFSRLATLACHDLRTPLATVHGFARTLEQSELEEPAAGYVAMIGQASAELAELIDELALAARIDGGRYDPVLREVDSLELARAAAERLGEDRVMVSGSGDDCPRRSGPCRAVARGARPVRAPPRRARDRGARGRRA